MSLRVLLADESSTIKRVMQLALQDFDVEVKAVPVGLDVIEVAKSFKPDIIFVDVLLAKRNGYEVSGDIKKDLHLKSVPVVLMWSGFMELDEKKAQAARPDRRIEKPFDADTLRGLVKELVPRTQGNVISNFLSFPNLPDIEEPEVTMKLPPIPQDSMDDEAEEFQSVPLPKIPENTPDLRSAMRNLPSEEAQKEMQKESDAWSHQDLNKFKIPVDEDDLSADYEMTGDDLTRSSIAISSSSTSKGKNSQPLEEISLQDLDKLEKNISSPPLPPIPKVKAPLPPIPEAKTSGTGIHGGLPSMTSVSHERAEQILREQVRQVLESIAWKIIPDMTERIVREEIQKLMKDAERL